MRIDAKKDRAQAKDMVAYYWPIKNGNRHILGNACGFDSDEKWIEIYVWSPMPPDVRDTKLSHRIMTADGRAIKAKIYINYDIVDKRTGETILSVRQ